MRSRGMLRTFALLACAVPLTAQQRRGPLLFSVRHCFYRTSSRLECTVDVENTAEKPVRIPRFRPAAVRFVDNMSNSRSSLEVRTYSVNDKPMQDAPIIPGSQGAYYTIVFDPILDGATSGTILIPGLTLRVNRVLREPPTQ